VVSNIAILATSAALARTHQRLGDSYHGYLLNLILIVRPATVAGAEYLSRRFSKRYTVRRSAIEHWLYFLKINHPDYRDVEICSNRLTRLSENGSILDQLPSINESDSDSSNPIAYPSPTPQAELAPTSNPTPAINHLPIELGNGIHDSEFDDVLDTFVPDLMPDLGELELLSREVQYQEDLRAGPEVPSVRQTPLSERSANHIMRGAFPTLFPYSRADFDIPQRRMVTLAVYAKHMLKYQDGRFGRHLLF
jgi:hypothetical protein